MNKIKLNNLKKRSIEETDIVLQSNNNRRPQGMIKKYRPTFNIEAKYITNCYQIWNSLMSTFNTIYPFIYSPQYFGKLIAEYAATDYLPCDEPDCMTRVNFIECTKDCDYDGDSGRWACFDEFDKIRYFSLYPLDYDSDGEHIEPEDYVIQEIKCIDCSSKYECITCSIVIFPEFGGDLWRCVVCKSPMCDLCAVILADFPVLNEPDSHHTVCQNCWDDGNLTDDTIKQSIGGEM